MTHEWYIGFDISTSLGWDLRNPSGVSVAGGVVALRPGPGGENHEYNTYKISKVVTAAQEIVAESARRLGSVATLEPALEDVNFSAFTKSTASYWRVRTVLEIVLRRLLLTPKVYLVVDTSSLKTYAMGGPGKGEGPKGQVTKRQMVEACQVRDGTEFPPWELTASGAPTAESKRSGDRADAAHVSHWAWSR